MPATRGSLPLSWQLVLTGGGGMIIPPLPPPPLLPPVLLPPLLPVPALPLPLPPFPELPPLPPMFSHCASDSASNPVRAPQPNAINDNPKNDPARMRCIAAKRSSPCHQRP